jgi:predicted Holliday junction resolvase-like endonuclease
MTSSDVIGIFAITVPVICLILGGVIAHLVRKVSLLEGKVEAKNETIAELKRQNDKLEITGTLANRFFSQLPNVNEIKRELQQ